MAAFRAQQGNARRAARQLDLSRSRFDKLYAESLRACAHQQQDHWTPGTSGGDPAAAWPPEVTALLRQRLSSHAPANDSFAASEVLRLCGFKLDRAQVRHWAIEHHLAPPKPNAKTSAPIRRWQRAPIGELWQLDASPHRWFPAGKQLFPRLNLLDDCRRLFTASKLYQHETLLA